MLRGTRSANYVLGRFRKLPARPCRWVILGDPLSVLVLQAQARLGGSVSLTNVTRTRSLTLKAAAIAPAPPTKVPAGSLAAGVGSSPATGRPPLAEGVDVRRGEGDGRPGPQLGQGRRDRPVG